MTLATRLEWLKERFQSRFIRNLGWLGISKLIIRFSRLFATVALARYLTRYDYGLAALVLTTYEFTQIFTRAGIGAKLIQADEEDLEELCNGAYWLNWVLYGGLFVLQCALAFPVAWFYRENQLILPICAMALIYLISPLGRIQATLIERENRLKISALGGAAQGAFANILTAVFALAGFQLWAIVLPRVLATPINIFVSLRYHSWRPSGGFTTRRWREIFRFGWNILFVSLLNTLRDNLDYLIVGRFLGVKALGLYYFAFNSGLGISLEITMAIGSAIYPHICAARSSWDKFKKSYFDSLKVMGAVIVPLVLLQSSMAPLYVPIIFGGQWKPAIPILMIICLSGIPRAFMMVSSFLLNAVDKPHLNMYWNLVFTVLFALGILVSVRWNILGVGITVLVLHLVFVPIFVIWVSQFVFGQRQSAIKGE